MKKQIALLLILAMILCFAGCHTIRADETDSAEEKSTENTSVNSSKPRKEEATPTPTTEQANSFEETALPLSEQKCLAEETTIATNSPEPSPISETEETSDNEEQKTTDWMDYAREYEAMFLAAYEDMETELADILADDFDEVMSDHDMTYAEGYSRESIYDAFLAIIYGDEYDLYDYTTDSFHMMCLYGVVTGADLTNDETYGEVMAQLVTLAHAFVNKAEIASIMAALAAYSTIDNTAAQSLYSWFINTQYDEFEDSELNKEDVTTLLSVITGLDLQY